VTVFTNARWAEPELLLAEMKRYPKLSGLLVSLHGARAAAHEAFTLVAGSFDEAVANIRRAVDAGMRVSLSTILTRYSCDEIEAVVQLGQELGVSGIAFNRYLGQPMPSIEPSGEQMKQAVVQIGRLAEQGSPLRFGVGIPQCYVSNASEGCLAGVAYAVIDPWGTLRPCAHSPSEIGSLGESSLYDLWHSPAMDAWRAAFPPDCTDCAAVEACHGGCRALPELLHLRRDPLRKNPLRQYRPPATTRRLPAGFRPKANLRLREEAFGFVVLGKGSALPVRAEALAVLRLCDGSRTFTEIAKVVGAEGINLLGELWERGLLDGE
jgi:radical SAM protein with 4Fe4S-binding SPASM domain